MNNTSTYGWFQLDLSGKGVGEAWHASNDGETEMADATDPRGGAALCALEGAVLTGFGTCLFDTNLGDNRSNQEVLVITEVKCKGLKSLSLLIMNLIMV